MKLSSLLEIPSPKNKHIADLFLYTWEIMKKPRRLKQRERERERERQRELWV